MSSQVVRCLDQRRAHRRASARATAKQKMAQRGQGETSIVQLHLLRGKVRVLYAPVREHPQGCSRCHIISAFDTRFAKALGDCSSKVNQGPACLCTSRHVKAPRACIWHRVCSNLLIEAQNIGRLHGPMHHTMCVDVAQGAQHLRKVGGARLDSLGHTMQNSKQTLAMYCTHEAWRSPARP